MTLFQPFSREKGKPLSVWEEWGCIQRRQGGSGGTHHFTQIWDVHSPQLRPFKGTYYADVSQPGRIVLLHEENSIKPCPRQAVASAKSRGSRRRTEFVWDGSRTFPQLWQGLPRVWAPSVLTSPPSAPERSCLGSFPLEEKHTCTTSTIRSHPPPQQNSTLQCTHFSPWGEGVRFNLWQMFFTPLRELWEDALVLGQGSGHKFSAAFSLFSEKLRSLHRFQSHSNTLLSGRAWMEVCAVHLLITGVCWIHLFPMHIKKGEFPTFSLTISLLLFFQNRYGGCYTGTWTIKPQIIQNISEQTTYSQANKQWS